MECKVISKMPYKGNEYLIIQHNSFRNKPRKQYKEIPVYIFSFSALLFVRLFLKFFKAELIGVEQPFVRRTTAAPVLVTDTSKISL